jgi:hypothetical protein
MATIDDLTLATTDLLHAVTVGKETLDLAVDTSAANMYTSTTNKNAAALSETNALAHKNAASAFATNASNSAVTASVRATEASNYSNLAQASKDTSIAQASIATTKASEASASEIAAELAATEAAASALTAFSSPTTQGHSITAMTLAPGMQTITIETGKYFVPGMSIMVAFSTDASAIWCHGVIDEYTIGTGVLVFYVDLINGAGTYEDWVISLSAPVGTNSINLSGIPTAPTAIAGTNTTQIATTAFVVAEAASVIDDALEAFAISDDPYKANLVSPAFTGIPTVPTAALNTATTQIASTAFVANALEENGGGGIEWSVKTANATTAPNEGFLVDTSELTKTITLHATPEVGDTIAVGDYAGTFDIYYCTIARNSMLIDGVAEDRLLRTKNEVMTLVYSGATKGWVTVGSLAGDYPKTVLNKPFAHFQDQKAYNVDGGTSIADAWTKRTLNTVITNDIQGAELTGGLDGVSLPAGTYYVEASQRLVANTIAALLPGIFVNNTLAVQDVGETTQTSYSTGGSVVRISGVVTLLTPGVIDLRYYVGVAEATTGLGVKNSTGSIADTSLPSIYADLKIWQLDRSLEIAPKAINSGLQTIAGMNTEGNIMGFDVTVSGNTLTITKGSCMSSDLTVPLAFTADKTCVLPGTVNGDFYVFAVRLLDGVTYEARAYSTYVGPSSDAQIDKWRFISFAKNNGSGVTMPFKQVGDRIDWTVATNRPILTASTIASYVAYSISAILPITILKDVYISSIGAYQCGLSYDGTTEITGSQGISIGRVAPLASIYIKYTISSSAIHIASATLRR